MSEGPPASLDLPNFDPTLPTVVLTGDNVNTDFTMAALAALNPDSGVNVFVVVSGPEVLIENGGRDVDASNDRQENDAARILVALRHLGHVACVYTGVDRGDERTRGLRNVIPETSHIEIRNYDLWPAETAAVRREGLLAGNFDALIRRLADVTGDIHLVIGGPPTEAVALLNAEQLRGRFGLVVMQGSHKDRSDSLKFAKFSFNGDSDPQSMFELLFRYGAHLLSSEITRQSPPAYESIIAFEEDMTRRTKGLDRRIPQDLFTLLSIHRATADAQNVGTRAGKRPSRVASHDGLAVVSARGLILDVEQPFTYTEISPTEIEEGLRAMVNEFYPTHITPEFLASLGLRVEEQGADKVLVGDFSNLATSYDVASVEDVDVEVARQLLALLISRPIDTSATL